VTPNKGSGPQFGETFYISEINGASNVISDVQVTINKNVDAVQKFFFR